MAFVKRQLNNTRPSVKKTSRKIHEEMVSLSTGNGSLFQKNNLSEGYFY